MYIYISPEMLEIIPTLRKETKQLSTHDVVATALVTYAWIVDHQKKSNIIVVKNPSGDEVERLANLTK